MILPSTSGPRTGTGLRPRRCAPAITALVGRLHSPRKTEMTQYPDYIRAPVATTPNSHPPFQGSVRPSNIWSRELETRERRLPRRAAGSGRRTVTPSMQTRGRSSTREGHLLPNSRARLRHCAPPSSASRTFVSHRTADSQRPSAAARKRSVRYNPGLIDYPRFSGSQYLRRQPGSWARRHRFSGARRRSEAGS